MACSDHHNTQKTPATLQELRKETQKNIHSIVEEINKRYEPYVYADSLVRNDTSEKVLAKLDSLILLYPTDDKIYLCKGYWYHRRKLYSKALNEYKIATKIAGDPYPLLLDREAKAYIGLNMLDSAIKKYKEASTVNRAYYFELANAFELHKDFDSALYYYKTYFNEHSYDTIRRSHWDSLSSHSSNR